MDHTLDTEHTRVIHASRVPASVYLIAGFREQGESGTLRPDFQMGRQYSHS